ncbi:hypothetical protein [Aeromonas phage 62AhydR11PP]|nr:hypothetical protein [Aeromonas phage 62AhydR11PP]
MSKDSKETVIAFVVVALVFLSGFWCGESVGEKAGFNDGVSTRSNPELSCTEAHGILVCVGKKEPTK